ncbi:MAG: hypothetical protein ACR5K2_03835 [Wolbachia sp.]
MILYEFMSYEAYNEIWNMVCSDKDKENKSFEKYKFYINALHVEVTRAIDSVYIVDNENSIIYLK